MAESRAATYGRRMKLPAAPTALFLLIAGASLSAAQQTISDVEPNHVKELATPAFDLVDGDMLVAWGFGGCGAGPPDVDYFRARTLHLPPGIYRHDLVDMGSSTLTEMRLVGLDAIQETVIPGSYDYLQTEPLDGTGNGFVSWYGFGKSEEVYVDLYASYSCRSVVTAALMTSPVTPTDLGLVNPSGQADPVVHLQASGATTPVDVEIQLFDADFNAIPAFGLDVVGTAPAGVSGSLGDGVYYVAVSDHNLATHLPHRIVHGESRTLAGALDFAGAVACGSDATGVDLRLELFTSDVGTITTDVTKSSPYEVAWFRFQVGTGQHSTVYCAGDGNPFLCPNGNEAPRSSGMGCVNSTGRGATLMRGWRFDFTLEDLPPLATALLFVSPNVAPAPAASGDGLVCVGPGALRAGPVSANVAGSASTDAWTNGLAAAIAAGGSTVYLQAAYRDATATGFNFTNALAITP